MNAVSEERQALVRPGAPKIITADSSEIVALDDSPTSDTAEAWADYIRPDVEQLAFRAIVIGTKLNLAKTRVRHGEFQRMVKMSGIATPTMAGRFMRVAANQVLAKCAPVHGLPSAVSVLEVLTRLDDDDLQAAIDTGNVTSATTRNEALALVAGTLPETEGPLAPEPIVPPDPRVVAEIAQAIRNIDRAIAAHASEIQARDSFLDISHVYVFMVSRWWPQREDEPDGIAEIADAMVQITAGQCYLDVEHWHLAMVWVGDTDGVAINVPFAEQLVGAWGGRSLEDAAERWLAEEQQEVAS